MNENRIQNALNNRIGIYVAKMRQNDPLAEDAYNRHDLYAFAIECFDVFATEAGLSVPLEAKAERTGA
jgi:hypothetical protein